MELIRDDNIIRSFEVRVFHYALIVALVFRSVRLVHEYLIASPVYIILVGILNVFLLVLVLLFYKRFYLVALTIFYFQTLVTSILTWNNAGAWNGSIPYIFLMMLVAIIITSHGVFQVLTLLSYGLVIALFAFTDILNSFSFPNDRYANLSMEVDFFISTLILVSVTLYLKNSFFTFRESVELNNERLMESSQTFTQQNRKLLEQQAALNAIRNNLEEITSSKINEVRLKSETLKEYAFINAHHVRGPLARVLGLVYLMEMENPDEQKTMVLNRIKKEAEEMDAIIGKINEVIG